MIKKFFAITAILIITSGCALAADYNQTITPEVASGIKKYKQGNYVGCLQDLYNYTKRSENNLKNQLAIYYMGMAYTKTGNTEKAALYYRHAKALNPNNTIGKYADKGLVCINDPANCYTVVKENTQENKKPVYESDLDKFINAPYGNGLSSDLNKEIERKRVERLRKEMNSDQEINKFEFKNFRDFTNKKGQAILNKFDGIKLASDTTPTDAEILKAIKVLNAAGLNNIAKQAETATQKEETKQPETAANQVKSEYKPDLTREEYQKQIQQEMMQAQMAAMSQPNIDALFGEKNNQNNMNNMNMMNMLPFIMAQQAQQAQNGNSNGQMMMSPDVMQAMMFNSMMPNFNFGLDSGK